MCVSLCGLSLYQNECLSVKINVYKKGVLYAMFDILEIEICCSLSETAQYGAFRLGIPIYIYTLLDLQIASSGTTAN